MSYIASAVTTISVILVSSKIQNGDILILANPGQPEKMAVKMESEFENLHQGLKWMYFLM